ncbi:MAG: branched-chain amino acid ABC transporter permease [Streptosporangiales bacterium]|nr:branched-chain amino acid ABC transporter permease [Streptosporangiales bacterium]
MIGSVPLRRAALGVLVAAALLVAGRAVDDFQLRLLTEALIFGLFAMSLDLLLGYTGLPSLGHAAYFGTAAYTTGVIAAEATSGFWLPAAAGVGASVLLALLFGLVALRTRGVYFLMITLALGQLTVGLALRNRSLTGGADGLAGVPRPDLGVGWNLWPTQNFYYFTLAVVAVAALVLWLVVRSPFGVALRGIRDNEARMDALGYHVWLRRYVAFVLAGGFAGVAGVLFVYHNAFVSPDALGLATSAEVLLMVILGGAGTLFGPLLGAGVLVTLNYTISSFAERWVLFLGAVYVLTVLVARRGLWRAVPVWARGTRSMLAGVVTIARARTGRGAR